MKIKELPLIFFTLMIELAAGIFISLLIYQALTLNRDKEIYQDVSIVVILITVGGLFASLFHLGKPFGAYRAFYGLKNNSPLSWEVLITFIFLIFTFIYSSELFRSTRVENNTYYFGILTGIIGLVAILISGRVYMFKSRPAWFTLITPLSFLMTSIISGPVFILVYLVYSGRSSDARDLLNFIKLASIILISGLIIESFMTYYHLKTLNAGGAEARLTAKEIIESRILKIRVVIGIIIPFILAIIMAVLSGMKIMNIIVILTLIIFISILIGEFLSRVIFYTFCKQIDIGILEEETN